MKKIVIASALLLISQIQALDYEVQIDNERVKVARVKVMPQEEIGLHRDEYPQVVIALEGGTITRLESDNRIVDVQFPTNIPIFRMPDPEGQLHKSMNRSSKPIELITIQIK